MFPDKLKTTFIMKSSWQILTILLAVALVILSIKITMFSSNENSSEINPQTDEEAAMDIIMTRSSVRKYTSQTVETDKVDKMLKAAMAAPTAGNRQPWEFVVITDKEILNQIPPIIKGAHMAANAPLAIVVCGEPARSFPGALSEYWVQDCSAATENLLLASHAMGLGAVWCGVYPDSDNRVEKMRNLLSLPKGIYPLNVIVIGYPDGAQTVKDKWMPNRVHYNKF